MSLLKFFKPVNSLPSAKETGITDHAASSANHAVQKMLEKESCKRGEDPSGDWKRKHTMSFTVEDCAQVDKYAAQSRVAVAWKHFKQLNLSESTVHYFRKKDLHEVSKRAETGNSTEVCGGKVALEEALDTEIKWCSKRLRDSGTAVSVALVQVAAEGYLLSCDRTVLVEYGRHVCLFIIWYIYLQM